MEKAIPLAQNQTVPGVKRQILRRPKLDSKARGKTTEQADGQETELHEPVVWLAPTDENRRNMR